MRFSLFLLFFCCSIPLFAQQNAVGDSVVPCFFVQKINITGSHKTKDRIILRELSFKEGSCIPKAEHPDILDPNALPITELNRQRLMNLRLFNEVKLTWVPLTQDTFLIEINVIDRFPIIPDVNFEFADRNFNVWWTEQHHDLNRINLGLTLNDNNFRGNHETLAATAQLGYTQKVGLIYARPFVDKDQKHGFGVSVFGLQNREIAYNTEHNKLRFLRSNNNFMQRRFDASVWYTYRPKYASTHNIQFSYHHYWISDTIALLNPSYLGNGNTQEDVLQLQYRYEYNGVDNWNYPLKGFRFIGNIEGDYALNNGSKQSSINLHYDYYWNPLKYWYIAGIVRSRFSVGADQPYIFRRNLGYDFDYVRGYEYYVMDGSAFALGRLDIKRELLHWKMRLPVRYFEVIPVRIYAKVFGDCGAGYNKYPVTDNFSNKALYSTGVGIDIITLYDIKVRIEYTVNRLNEKGLYLHRNGE